MDQATHNKIVSFIWGIADDVLRDLFKRGKYPDVILPMFVIRRMDAVLEPTKKAVLDTKKMLDEARIAAQLDHSNIVQTTELGEHDVKLDVVAHQQLHGQVRRVPGMQRDRA